MQFSARIEPKPDDELDTMQNNKNIDNFGTRSIGLIIAYHLSNSYAHIMYVLCFNQVYLLARSYIFCRSDIFILFMFDIATWPLSRCESSNVFVCRINHLVNLKLPFMAVVGRSRPPRHLEKRLLTNIFLRLAFCY